MPLYLKNICSLNVEGMPFKNSVFNKIRKWDSIINKETSSLNEDEDDLNIFCIQGLYGYKCGFIGKLFNTLFYNLSPCTHTIFIQSILKIFCNTDSSDLELLSFLISLISRLIPGNNLGIFDPKDLINPFKFKNKNQSYESLFNLNSLFLLKPIFDSGCAIYSNRKAISSDFEKWETAKKHYTNKGMVWSYFESYTCDEGITIINLDFNNNNTIFEDINNLNQIVNLKNRLEDRFGKDLESYETYIIGNFNIMFNLNTILVELDEKLQILKNANLEIINRNNDNTSTEFLLYGKLKTFEMREFIDLSYKIEDEDILTPFFYKFHINRSLSFTINPILQNKHLIKEENEIIIHQEKEITTQKEKEKEITTHQEKETINPIKIYQTIVRESYFNIKNDSIDDWEQVV